MPGRTPYAAVQAFIDALQFVLSCITRAVLDARRGYYPAPTAHPLAFRLMLLAMLVGRLSVPFEAPLAAETPAVMAQTEPTLNMELTIPPGETVIFVRPSFRVQGALSDLRVINQSDQLATAVDDGRVLTLSVPAGSTLQAEVVYVGPSAQTVPCPIEPQSPNVARCTVHEYRATKATVHVAATPAPPATERLPLLRGCNNVVLTWPAQTPLELVARAVSPEGALEAIWRFSQGRFVAYAPAAPSMVNDYVATSARLEAVFVCMRASGEVTRPAI